MKTFIKFITLLFIVGVFSGCSKVDQGYEAAKINTLGTDKGSVEILGQGRHFYNVLKYDLIQNPLFFQEYVWTANETEGSKKNEAISFQSSNALTFTANVGAKIALKPGKTGDLWAMYHKKMDKIIITNFANTLRDAFNRKASERSEKDIYGSGKTKFIEDVTTDIQNSWKEFLVVERIYLIGSLEPPTEIKKSISAKIQATQKAQQRRNEVEQSKAEADKKIEVARGEATSKNLATDAEVYAITKKAEAEAKAIELMTRQLSKSEAYVDYIKATTWDGKLPTYMGGNSPIPMITVK